MNKTLINDIVESLFSDNVNQKYIDMYLSDSELRKQCDSMILQVLENDFSNGIYNSEKSLCYLNNVIKSQLKKKPYLLYINPIEIAIENRIVNIQNERFVNASKHANGPYEAEQYHRENDSILEFSNKIHDFTYENIDVDAEERIANIYIQRMKNNNELSKDQVEELLAFSIMGGFILKHEEYTDKAFDYALRSILKNDYKIDSYLYKGLFMHSCKKILDERGITDVTIFYVSNENNELGNYNNLSKRIYIDEKKLIEVNPIKNFMTFFHELRHYEQYNSQKEDLKSFLINKDIYLSDILPRDDYYKENYYNLFLEKDACYASYEGVHDFVKEKAPSRLKETKKEIYKDLKNALLFQNQYITKRKIDGVVKDSNVLFEETVRKRKRNYKVFNEFIKSSILIEYDIFGNKRSIFELLASKEFNEREGFIERATIINYLLYEESVSLDYINENLKLFDSGVNKERFGKYYKEAKRVIKHKLIRYRADVLAKKNDVIVVDALRNKNVRGLNKNKNIELYNKKMDELRITYKWLYDLMNEEKDKSK